MQCSGSWADVAGWMQVKEGWQQLIEQVPIHDGKALLSMLRLMASLVLLGRRCVVCPRRLTVLSLE